MAGLSAQIRPAATGAATSLRAVGPSLLVTGDEGPLILSQPVPVDLIVYRGDTGLFRITVENTDGSPHSVVGATWDADIRASADDSTVIASMTVAPVSGDPASVDVLLTSGVSASILDSAVYDVEMTQAGVVTTLIAGRVVLTKDVSRV